MKRTWLALRRAARAVANFASEMNYWQRRKAVLSMAPDRHIADPSRPPDTFAEFLARTHGPLIREPSARARQAGRQVG